MAIDALSQDKKLYSNASGRNERDQAGDGM
jgi:hypothetical protein